MTNYALRKTGSRFRKLVDSQCTVGKMSVNLNLNVNASLSVCLSVGVHLQTTLKK